MIEVLSFSPADLDQMEVQPMQAHRIGADKARWARVGREGGPAWTVRNEAGRILLCGGFIVIHSHYALAWTVLAEGKGADFVAMTRRVRFALDSAPWRRVELHTDPEFPEAARWARLLGFRCEGQYEAVLEDGSDQCVWARIRGNAHG